MHDVIRAFDALYLDPSSASSPSTSVLCYVSYYYDTSFFSGHMVGTGGCLINVTIHADMAHGTILLFGLVATTLPVGKVFDIVTAW